MAVGIYRLGIDAADELPHPAIPLSVFLVVEAALLKTWELMLTQPAANFDLSTAVEDRITFELHRRLKNEVLKKRLVPGFDREIFGDVTREPKVDSYNQASIDKMPDLLVTLAGRPTAFLPSQDAIFIECKPVDLQHPAGGDYCDKGLIRYVRGDYAWAMTSALMVAYCRPGYAINPKLVDALNQRKKTIITTSPPVCCAKSKPSNFADAVHISGHQRSFIYLQTRNPAPPINIRHLWLRRKS